MYDLTLTIGNNTLNLNPSNGYYITTIDGLTGVNAAFNTDKNMLTAGENIRSKSISGRTLQVRGVILDGHTAAGLLAKDRLLEYITAGSVGTLLIKRTPRVTAAANVQANVWVKASPTITQERHSKFAFSLYMPFPYFEDVNITTYQLYPLSNIPTVLSGSSDVEYELSAKATGANVTSATLATLWSAISQELRIDFTKSSAGYLAVGSSFLLKRADGELVLTVTDSNNATTVETQCVDLTSDLWLLPRGINSVELSVSGGTGASYTDGLLKYRRNYENVMVT